jgi:Flp pilus assembly protein TadD
VIAPIRSFVVLVALACAALAQVRYTEIVVHIVLEDGSPMASNPLIVVDPGYSCPSDSFRDGTVRIRVPYVTTGGSVPGCRISVRLTGYQPFSGWVEDGTAIKLLRVGPHEGATVSKNNVNAPADARKRYEAGEAAAAKQKWAQAEEQFRAALAIYPDYAAALTELGRALERQGRVNDAIAPLNRARETDPQDIKPIAQLAEIAGLQQHWEDEMRLSQQALKTLPVGFTVAWFTYAEAAFHLAPLADAEKIAREAIRLDKDGVCPESMVLLGRIFEKQGNTADAVVEYKAYLRTAPHGPEAEFAKQALGRLK